MSIHPVSFFSGALYRRMSCFVYLPPDYDRTNRSYPVVYLLHGMYGSESDWIVKGNVEQIVERRIAVKQLQECIVVMPSDGGYGHGTFYTDWYDGTGKYEQYFIYDLVTFIDSAYSTIADRSARAVCGLSMGGYGAFVLALRYPELFATAASMSGAVGSPSMLPAKEFSRSEFARMTGPQNSPYALERDLFVLAEQRVNEAVKPNLYMNCGTEDYLLDLNREFRRHLQKLGFPHLYEEFPGEHTWPYWTAHLPDALAFLADKFKQNEP